MILSEKVNIKRRAWVSWERHIRSRELSSHFDFDLFEIITSRKGFVRYAFLSLKTLWILIKIRPKILAVQNPSIVLAAIGVIFKPIFGYVLIVDRHTNFKFDLIDSKKIKMKLFFCLSEFSIKRADYTVVTNPGLARIVRRMGGNPVILADKIPEFSCFSKSNAIDSGFDKNILLVCSFDDDEPTDSFLQAFLSLQLNWKIHVSGNWRKKLSLIDINRYGEKVSFSGFLLYEDYVSLMAGVDGVVVFTRNEFTLTCGAYEAISLNKPLLLTDTKTLKRYFGLAAVYCKVDDRQELISGIKQLNKVLMNDTSERQQAIISVRNAWGEQSKQFDRILSEI